MQLTDNPDSCIVRTINYNVYKQYVHIVTNKIVSKHTRTHAI